MHAQWMVTVSPRPYYKCVHRPDDRERLELIPPQHSTGITENPAPVKGALIVQINVTMKTKHDIPVPKQIWGCRKSLAPWSPYLAAHHPQPSTFQRAPQDQNRSLCCRTRPVTLECHFV